MKTLVKNLAFLFILLSFCSSTNLKTSTLNTTAAIANTESTASAPPILCSVPDLFSYKAIGNRLTPQMKARILNARPGTIIYFEDITAVGPDGIVRTLAPIKIKIQ